MTNFFPGYLPDAAGLRRLLADYLPERLFDAHLHITESSDFSRYADALRAELPQLRQIRAMLIPMPDRTMHLPGSNTREQANRLVKKQLDACPGTVGQIFVMPGDSCDDIFAMADHPAIRGLKCYFYSADRPNPAIAQYLPESAWQVANEKRMAITLHLAQPDSLSAADDLAYIKTMLRRYPDAKLILAHCGRAFAAWTCREPVKQLQGYENLYYDLSAICEPAPIYYCLKYAGSGHVLWGSDYPISAFRGRAVSVGSGFAWLEEAAIQGCHPSAPPMTVLQENLLAVCTAMDMLELSCSDVEGVFYRNMEDSIFD